jgi:formate dehydrogenase iron-sulfur subunit
VAVGQAPACAKACPTGAIQFGSKEQMKDYAAKRVGRPQVARLRQGRALRSAGVGGTHVMYVLHHADRPELYKGLPNDPSISPLVSLWKGFAKPLASVAMAAVALGSLFHYVMKGPNEVSARSLRTNWRRRTQNDPQSERPAALHRARSGPITG